MSREVKRVSFSFEWELQKPWPGFINPYLVDCPVCDGEGDNCGYGIMNDESGWCIHPDFAELCEKWSPIEPTPGDGWQLWETVSEGSPVSPVCKTLEELTAWMVDNKYSAWAIQWVQEGKTWLPSGMGYNGALSFVQDHS